METCLVNMEEIESDIQKKLLSFCKLLPIHVQSWKEILGELQRPITAIVNYSEQLRFVEQANIKNMDNFENIQKGLQIRILGNFLDKVCLRFTFFESRNKSRSVLGCIEDELLPIKSLLEKLTKSNSDLKNKLATLERATVDLDWDIDSSVVKGSPNQPRLDKLLQMAYEFWMFFSETLKNMTSKLKTLDLRDGKFMQSVQQAFTLNLEPLEENSVIYLLLALTQYLDDKT